MTVVYTNQILKSIKSYTSAKMLFHISVFLRPGLIKSSEAKNILNIFLSSLCHKMILGCIIPLWYDCWQAFCGYNNHSYWNLSTFLSKKNFQNNPYSIIITWFFWENFKIKTEKIKTKYYLLYFYYICIIF